MDYVQNLFFQRFSLMLAHHKEIRDMIRELLLHLPFSGKGCLVMVKGGVLSCGNFGGAEQ